MEGNFAGRVFVVVKIEVCPGANNPIVFVKINKIEEGLFFKVTFFSKFILLVEHLMGLSSHELDNLIFRWAKGFPDVVVFGEHFSEENGCFADMFPFELC